LTLILRGWLNSQWYFSVKKSSHWEKIVQCVSLDSNSSLELDANRVKIEVKQVDNNYIWLYNENQYLNVELSDFFNYG